MKQYIKNKNSWLFLLILTFFAFLGLGESKASEGEFSRAFAEFIEVLHANTQTINRANSICLYGHDDVSSYLESNSKNAIVLGEVTKGFNLKTCRIIYVAKSKEKFVKSFIANLNQSGGLTVATFDSFVSDGGMIFIDIGRRDFELTIDSQSFNAS